MPQPLDLILRNLHAAIMHRNGHSHKDVRQSSLLPKSATVPSSRWVHPSVRLRTLLDAEPFVFAPGVYDPFTAQQAMYYGFPVVYFSGYSFAMGTSARLTWTCMQVPKLLTPREGLSVPSVGSS